MAYDADLTHLLNTDGDRWAPSDPSDRLTRFFVKIAAAGSVRAVGEPVRTPLPCRRRPGRKPCRGTIELMRRRDGVIQWQCPRCGDEGVIRGWEGTCGDLRRLGRLHLVSETVSVVVDREDYRTLDGCVEFSVEDESIVRGAVLHEDGVLLRETPQDLDLLADAVAAEALHETRSRRRHALERIYERITGALRGA